MTDSLGDRMKSFEDSTRLMQGLPIMVRIDGRTFSSFTRGMDKPYDARMSKLMEMTCTYLVSEFNADMGYTQSDEITLTWYNRDFFGGKVQKIVSVLAAATSVYFNANLYFCFGERRQRSCPDPDAGSEWYMPSEELEAKLPHFDCRVWNVPTLEEGANVFLWREQDATKNSIGMAACAYYSHNQLHGKHSVKSKKCCSRRVSIGTTILRSSSVVCSSSDEQ